MPDAFPDLAYAQTGVRSTTDARWNHTFEDVFTADSLKGDDFFRALLGNHDHLGSPTAQVNYSSVSNRWRYEKHPSMLNEHTMLPASARMVS